MSEALSQDDKIMGVIGNLEKVLLVAIPAFGIFLLWYCVLRKVASPQPRSYMYEGDTVATDDDRIELGEDDGTKEESNHNTKTKTIIATALKVNLPAAAKVPEEINLSVVHGEDIIDNGQEIGDNNDTSAVAVGGNDSVATERTNESSEEPDGDDLV